MSCGSHCCLLVGDLAVDVRIVGSFRLANIAIVLNTKRAQRRNTPVEHSCAKIHQTYFWTVAIVADSTVGTSIQQNDTAVHIIVETGHPLSSPSFLPVASSKAKRTRTKSVRQAFPVWIRRLCPNDGQTITIVIVDGSATRPDNDNNSDGREVNTNNSRQQHQRHCRGFWWWTDQKQQFCHHRWIRHADVTRVAILSDTGGNSIQ